MFRWLLFFILWCSTPQNALSQVPYYQDLFYGGVTGDGYSSINLETTDTLNIFIEPGSSIKKGILFINTATNTSGILENNLIMFNGIQIDLNINNALVDFYTDAAGSTLALHNVLAIDVTNLISPLDNTYTLKPPVNQDPTGQRTLYAQYYLFVAYENAALPLVSTSVFLNNLDSDQTVAYNFSDLNSIDPSFDAGFTFMGWAFCDTSSDGSFVFVNGNPIGLVGGPESPMELVCGGVRGAFYYQNNTLFGLDNDVANNTMSGNDALCSVSPYLTTNNQFSVEYEYQNGPGGNPKGNALFEFITAYTTTCDTFSVNIPSDTIVCLGDQVQLNASGGQSIEWFPSTGLSCDDCYNPVFTANSSMNYTVRIWNNDSCSVVRPVNIKVVPNPYFESVSFSPTDCGTSNGQVALSPDTNSLAPYTYALNGSLPQSANTFTSLSTGNQTFTITDNYGCSSDSLVFIPEQNSTVASIALDPTSGLIPLNITVSNNSTNATNFEWYLNGNYEGNTFTSFTCDTSGTYTVQLIAWQYDPSCADTVYAAVIAIQEIIVPTAFTPNNDQVNDVWEILNLDEQYPENIVRVYDRWGSLIFQSSPGNYHYKPWNGSYNDDFLPSGSYYFIIELEEGNDNVIRGNVSIIK